MNFIFEVGKTYKTQKGKRVKVLGRTDHKGYECLICSDKKHRYDRSTHSTDSGRVTGTDHDYSYPDNFKRTDRIQIAIMRNDIERMNKKINLLQDTIFELNS